MTRFVLTLLIGLLVSLGALVSDVSGVAVAYSKLPDCPLSGYKDDCFGAKIYSKGGNYVGEWRDGKRHGIGTYKFSDGREYVGEWKVGKMHGLGTYTFTNGKEYAGEWKNNKQNGEGNLSFPDGTVFSGDFKDNSLNGKCTLDFGTKSRLAGLKYIGDCEDSLMHGHGSYFFPNGDQYVGEFDNDKLNGQGSYTFADGSKYFGEVKNGKFNGQGTFTYSDGKTYAGEFRDNSKVRGTLSYLDGRMYSGEWQNDQINGDGVWTLANGDRYLGEFKDGEYDGRGTYTFSDGRAAQEGVWKDGVFLYAKEVTPKSATSANIDENVVSVDLTAAKTLNDIGLANSNLPRCDGSPKIIRSQSEYNALSKEWTSCSGEISLIVNGKRFGKYTGEFGAAGKPHGVGVSEWWEAHKEYSERRRYVGEWENDKQHGKGIMTRADGSELHGIWEHGKFLYTKNHKPLTLNAKAKQKVTPAALTASQKEAERLRQELAALKAEKAKQQQTISSDKKLPMITVASASSNGPQGTIVGRVTDNTGVAEVRMDGKTIKIDSNGNFSESTYVPEGGVSVSIQAIDLAGLSSSMSVRLDRSASTSTASISFERLNPLGRKVAKNKDALALIIGVDGYSKTPARAIYADSDAKVFADYASQKLGIPTNRIKTLVNDGADESGMLLAVKDWLSRASKKDKSDVYVFFAGHGLASQDGEKMYLLPYDGSPRLLEDTAISRDRLFADIAAANPRSVTVFLDTCYSGETRGNEMLFAGRPIGIRALKQSIPDNFTLMTAAAGDQIANPLKEAKHGMFSYFLMKGMEGLADSNQDNKITALELHEYVKENVWQQSSNKQLPELQGDENRVLVRFQ